MLDSPCTHGPVPAFRRFGPCYDPVTLAVIGATTAVAGGGVSAMGTLAAGKDSEQAYLAKQKNNEYLAKQLEDKARREREAGKNELAGAQVTADELRRRKELALSNLQAKSAAGGFSATDATSLKLAEDMEGYGTLQERRAVDAGQIKRAGSEAEARTYDAQAGGLRYEGWAAAQAGRAARRQSRIGAAGTILGTVSNLALRFGSPGGSSSSPYRFGQP